jgi:glycosyltransferase involved in cell wall biosynthesis
MPQVSIIVPSFNYARYLPLTIKSVLSQSYSDFELIITDDCSTDGSREIVEEWRRLDDRVTPVFHGVNRGLSAARNSALAVSRGKLVAFCDADDLWLPDKLKAQVECFRSVSAPGIVYSDSAIIDSEGNLTGKRFSQLYHRKGQVTSGDLFEELCQRNFLCVPTVVMRREAVEYAGGFDERLRSLEDWVCWTRASKNYQFYYIDDALAQYRIHGASLSGNSKSMDHNRVKAIEALLQSFPDIRPTVRSKMLYALGSSHVDLCDSRAAMRAFGASIMANPVAVRSWVRCCQSVLNAGVGMGRPRRAMSGVGGRPSL